MSEIVSTTNLVAAGAVMVAQKILGPVASELGDALGDVAATMLSDRIRVWRSSRMLKLAAEAAEKVQQRGRTPKPVPIELWLPILELAALVEDEDLRQRWSTLLANAADPQQEREPRAVFVRILQNLAPHDARVLDWIYEQGLRPIVGGEGFYASASEVAQAANVDDAQARVIMSNLFGQNVCEPGDPMRWGDGGATPMSGVYHSAVLTPLGLEFIRACLEPTEVGG